MVANIESRQTISEKMVIRAVAIAQLWTCRMTCRISAELCILCFLLDRSFDHSISRGMRSCDEGRLGEYAVAGGWCPRNVDAKTSLPKSSHGINRDRFVSVGSHAPEKSICRLC